jgi:hypothetical protein
LFSLFLQNDVPGNVLVDAQAVRTLKNDGKGSEVVSTVRPLSLAFTSVPLPPIEATSETLRGSLGWLIAFLGAVLVLAFVIYLLWKKSMRAKRPLP